MVFPNDFTRLSYYYKWTWLDEQALRLHVALGTITQAEFQVIVGKPYKQIQ